MNKEQRNQKILEFVKKHSYKETAIEFNLCIKTISNIVKNAKLDLKKSRCQKFRLNINEDYFAVIDTFRKAYWLGFICADGYISKDGKFSLISKDLEVIEKFKNDVSSEHKISIINNYDKRTNKTYTEYSIQIRNEFFIKNLLKWVSYNKTDHLEFPKIAEEYYSYFVAGLFDGDGSIYIKEKQCKCGIIKTVLTNLISTKEVLTFVLNYLNKFGFKISQLYKVTKNKNNVYKVYFNKDSIPFLDYIYQGDSNIFLSRKYLLYINNRHLKPSRNRIQPVLQYDQCGNYIQKFNSLKDVYTIFNKKINISDAIKNSKQCKNFYWLPYKNNNIIFKKIDIDKWKQYKQIVEIVEET